MNSQQVTLKSAGNAQDWALMRELIDSGRANVHAHQDYAIRKASKYGQLSLVEYLVEKGADIHVYDDAPLTYAAERGHCGTVRYLIEQGCDPKQGPALLRMAEYGYLGMVNFLVQDCKVNDQYKMTNALCAAVRNGHLQVTRYLLWKGASPQSISWMDIGKAAGDGHWDVLRYLVRKYNTGRCFPEAGHLFVQNNSMNAFLFMRQINNVELTGECPMYSARMMMVTNLLLGTIRCRVENKNGKPHLEESWGNNVTYDTNLGMLILSYVD